MQNQEVKIDLRVSRRESGLAQADLAHLLGITQPRVSRLEQGKSILKVDEIGKLAIIFDKSVTRLFRLLSARLKEELAHQVKSMPGDVVQGPKAELRQKTLNRLSDTLSASIPSPYAEDN